MADIFKVIKKIFKIIGAVIALIVIGFILLFVLAVVSGVLGFETFTDAILYNIIFPVLNKIAAVFLVPLFAIAMVTSDEPECRKCRRGIF